MSDSRRVEQYFQIRKTMERLVFFMGLWPSDNCGILYRFIPYLPLTLYCNAIIIIINSTVHHLDNGKIVTLSVGVIGVYMLCVTKVISLSKSMKQMLWFYKTVDELCSYYLNHKEFRQFVVNDVATCRIFFWIHTALCTFSGTMPLIIPILSIVNQQIHDVHPIKYNLIIPGQYFWNVSVNEFIYGVHFAVEAYTLMWTFYVGCLVDVLFAISLLQMTIPLRGMCYVIIHVCDKSDYGVTLHRCLIQYRRLIQCRDIIQDAYAPIIVGIAITCPIALCSLTWQVTQMDAISNLQKLRFATHAVAKILQALAYSWSSTILKAKSEDFIEKVYSSKWYGNKIFMNTVLMILMQRPLTIKAGHMTDVSLGMFVFAMKTSVSFYLLLQTVEQKSL